MMEASAYMGAAQNNPYLWVGDVACPTTILRARNTERKDAMDFSSSPTAPDLWKSFRAATDMQWSDVSHFVPMEAPDRLAVLIGDMLNRDS